MRIKSGALGYQHQPRLPCESACISQVNPRTARARAWRNGAPSRNTASSRSMSGFSPVQVIVPAPSSLTRRVPHFRLSSALGVCRSGLS
jgi:hypothetical protein